jgi:phosphate transport system ATP-binding protein
MSAPSRRVTRPAGPGSIEPEPEVNGESPTESIRDATDTASELDSPDASEARTEEAASADEGTVDRRPTPKFLRLWKWAPRKGGQDDSVEAAAPSGTPIASGRSRMFWKRAESSEPPGAESREELPIEEDPSGVAQVERVAEDDPGAYYLNEGDANREVESAEAEALADEEIAESAAQVEAELTTPQITTDEFTALITTSESGDDQLASIIDPPAALAVLEARAISAWFGDRKVLDRVDLTMEAGKITALIGPSGCGKSTFLRILNRMHEMVPIASLAGEVLLDGEDIYGASRRLTQARRDIGMVFQKPNPFPAMSIYDNVIAGLKLTGTKANKDRRDLLVESSLVKAGLWKEVRDRLRQPGGGLSGGQQQRLCIARSLAVRPRVLLMDEPCSALDPTSTRVIEETMLELAKEVTIVIVTHNMQQAQRVSDNCAFFLAAQNTPGAIVEQGHTAVMFDSPTDPRTFDYVNGRFG